MFALLAVKVYAGDQKIVNTPDECNLERTESITHEQDRLNADLYHHVDKDRKVTEKKDNDYGHVLFIALLL